MVINPAVAASTKHGNPVTDPLRGEKKTAEFLAFHQGHAVAQDCNRIPSKFCFFQRQLIVVASWKPWPQCCSNSKTKFTKADFFGLLGLEGLKFWDAPRVSAVCRLGVHTTALLSLILFYNIYIDMCIYIIYVSIYNYVYTHNYIYIYISCLWLMTIYRHVFRYCIYIRIHSYRK